MNDKIPHVNKKPLKRNFFLFNTVHSLYFKIRAKKVHARKPLAFSLRFLFRRDQNHHPNLNSKIMKMCEQFLKKGSAPMQFKFFWDLKMKQIILKVDVSVTNTALSFFGLAPCLCGPSLFGA